MKTIAPGPKTSFLGLDFAKRFKTDPLGTATSLQQEFGDVVHLKLGPYDWYVLGHPDHVKDVLVTRSRDFGKTDQFKKILSTVDGNGLVISEGDFWLRQRRIIQPVFHHDVLGEYGRVIVNQTKRWISKWESGQEMNLADELTNITLTIAAQIFLGMEVEDDALELGSAVTTVSKAMYREFTDVVPLPDWLPISSKQQKREAIATLDRMIHAAIARANASPESAGNMLGRMILARDPEGTGAAMTLKEVRDEAMTMFNAGHDSTAATLSWSFYMLLKNQQVYAQMVVDIQKTFGHDEAEPSRLAEVPLTMQVAKETMRLYPAAWIIPRQANQDLEIAEFAIAKGSLVNVFPYVTQRDERFWVRPNDFLPERFGPENEHKIVPFSWFPFGAGPRSCIGRDFALMEIQLVLITILQNFDLSLALGRENVEMNPMISLEPKGGVWVIPHAKNGEIEKLPQFKK